MIDKIVVNRKSGPAVAALDMAVKLGLDTGGWSGGDEPDFELAFGLEQVANNSSPSALERSVAASHGTLYFTKGKTAGTSLQLEKLKRCAMRLNRPSLVVRCDGESGFWTARTIAGWIVENQIRVLHVDGEYGDREQRVVCNGIADILEAVYFLAMANPGMSSPYHSDEKFDRTSRPVLQVETLEAALDHLESEMGLKDKATIANLARQELKSLDATLGDYIVSHFDLFSDGSRLLADCRRQSGIVEQSPENAAAVIIEKLWERLRATCRIRVVK